MQEQRSVTHPQRLPQARSLTTHVDPAPGGRRWSSTDFDNTVASNAGPWTSASAPTKPVLERAASSNPSSLSSTRTLSSQSSSLPSDKDINTVNDTVFHPDFTANHMRRKARNGPRANSLIAQKLGLPNSDSPTVPALLASPVDKTSPRGDPAPSASEAGRSTRNGPVGPVNLLNDMDAKISSNREASGVVAAPGRERSASPDAEAMRRFEEAEALLSFGEAAVVKSPDAAHQERPCSSSSSSKQMNAWSRPPFAPHAAASAASRSHDPMDCSGMKSGPRFEDPWQKPSPPSSSKQPGASPPTFDGYRSDPTTRVKLPSINDMIRDAPAIGPAKAGSGSDSPRSSAMVPSSEGAGPSRLYPPPPAQPTLSRDHDERGYRNSPTSQMLLPAGHDRRPVKEEVPEPSRYSGPRRPLDSGPIPFDRSPAPHHPAAYPMPQHPAQHAANPYAASQAVPWGPYGHGQYEVAAPYGGVVYVSPHAPIVYNGMPDMRGDAMMGGTHMAAASNAVRSLQHIPAPLLQPPRPRVSLACQFCRSRKLRCSQGPGPCDHCTRRGRECVFESTRQPKGGNPRGSVSRPDERQSDERGPTPPGSISTPSPSGSEPRWHAASSVRHVSNRYHPYDGGAQSRPSTS